MMEKERSRLEAELEETKRVEMEKRAEAFDAATEIMSILEPMEKDYQLLAIRVVIPKIMGARTNVVLKFESDC